MPPRSLTNLVLVDEEDKVLHALLYHHHHALPQVYSHYGGDHDNYTMKQDTEMVKLG